MSGVIGFYSPDQAYGCFSNWYACTFQFGNYSYSSAEQFMMAQKAAVFRDYVVFEQIMESTDQATIKHLGKKVAHYDDAVWSSLRGRIMRRGLRAKFQQNRELADVLLSTGYSILAECSQNDKIWGVGLDICDERVQTPQYWNGKNLLGQVLMEVRSDLKNWAAVAQGDIRYIDATDLLPNEIWSAPLPVIRNLPRIQESIDIYREVVEANLPKNSMFSWNGYTGSLADLEDEMRNNMGGGLPVAWFYEMKQDVYDTVRFAG